MKYMFIKKDSEDNVEVRIHDLDDGSYAVTFWDSDTGNQFPLVRIFPVFIAAKAYAETLVRS